MARKHRVLDAATGKIEVILFTAEEEVAANKVMREIAKENSAEYRINQCFSSSELGKVLDGVLLEVVNRLNELEGKPEIKKEGFYQWLIGKLPKKPA